MNISSAANVGHELWFDISNFTERAAYELEQNKGRSSRSDHEAVARNRISFRGIIRRGYYRSRFRREMRRNWRGA